MAVLVRVVLGKLCPSTGCKLWNVKTYQGKHKNQQEEEKNNCWIVMCGRTIEKCNIGLFKRFQVIIFFLIKVFLNLCKHI